MFFFFSSRRRHTRCLSDWSSDVCSSDLLMISTIMATKVTSPPAKSKVKFCFARRRKSPIQVILFSNATRRAICGRFRSEERRVGKECRSRWEPNHEKKIKTENYEAKERE